MSTPRNETVVIAYQHDSACDWVTNNSWCNCGLDEAYEKAIKDEAVKYAHMLVEQRDEATERAEVAERVHRDLTSRLGFGDGITEPQADNDTIVGWFEEQGREAGEWREHESWRNTCAELGCPEDADCFDHDPHLQVENYRVRAEAAERRVEELEAEREGTP